jgi:hypothetical protein
MEDRTMPMNQAVAAFFDNRSAAEGAMDDLLDLGVPRDAMTMAEGNDEGAAREMPGEGGGLFGVLDDTILPHPAGSETAGTASSRTGWIVTVEVDDERYERAVRRLGRDGSIIRDARADADIG